MYNRCYSEVVPLLEEKFPTILINFVWAKKWVNSRKEETPIHPTIYEEFVLISLLVYNLIREGLYPRTVDWISPLPLYKTFELSSSE